MCPRSQDHLEMTSTTEKKPCSQVSECSSLNQSPTLDTSLLNRQLVEEKENSKPFNRRRQKKFSSFDENSTVSVDVQLQNAITRDSLAEALQASNSITKAEVLFKPTREMQLVKNDFWAELKAGKITDVNGNALDTASALKLVKELGNNYYPEFGKWNNIKGFWKWFSRSPINEFSRDLNLLVQTSLEALYDIITNPNEKLNNSRVSAIKCVIELAGLANTKKQEVTILDKTVAMMTTEEKQKLIAQALHMSEKDED